ncbi:MAG: cob(I)yrinic acid a,c-diamide adenosyltransferase [Gammaproteobacteria bacterium]|jgi:cob(I)alamin adenosyltransferase
MATKLYTKTGDDGTTSSHPNTRAAKDDPYIEAYGCIDELNCVIGMVLANKNITQNLQKILQRTQQELSDLAKELYDPTQNLITEKKVAQIEQNIDQLNANLPELKTFILPGDNLSAATCHLARAICRRTERRLVSSCGLTAGSKKKQPNSLDPAVKPRDDKLKIILKYINRLSDLLFVIARSL